MSAATFGPGWDRQDKWTLRFLDLTIEQAYLDSMSEPGRHRMGTADLKGKSTPTPVCELLGLRESAEPA
jgi:hypothetical protein